MSMNKAAKQDPPASSEMEKSQVFRSHENSSGNSRIISDFNALEKKWQERWENEHIFEAIPNERKKYFCNYPYPYMNGFLHIGHGFTALRVDVAAFHNNVHNTPVADRRCRGPPGNAHQHKRIRPDGRRDTAARPNGLRGVEDLSFSVPGNPALGKDR